MEEAHYDGMGAPKPFMKTKKAIGSAVTRSKDDDLHQ